MEKYNFGHWSKRITQYLNEEWSKHPSPFVKMVATYIPENASVLELGTGAGQDGLWLATKAKNVTLTDGDTVAFDEIAKRAKSMGLKNVELKTQDLQMPLDFPDNSFDVVYSQLVIHYFDNPTMERIMSEIYRVLKPGGVIACMVNSTNDPEYDAKLAGKDGLINVNGLIKRYFNLETFEQFTTKYKKLVFDMNGRTPKDDAVNTSGMVQFIGRKDG